MECPFCVETIKDEALACKHCSRDLRVIRPVMLEIQDTVLELEKVRQELDRENSSLIILGKLRQGSLLPASHVLSKPYHFAPLVHTIEELAAAVKAA